MTWDEIARKVREGVAPTLYPIGSMIRLPYEGKEEWFEVLNCSLMDGEPTLTLRRLAHTWQPSKASNWTTSPSKQIIDGQMNPSDWWVNKG